MTRRPVVGRDRFVSTVKPRVREAVGVAVLLSSMVRRRVRPEHFARYQPWIRPSIHAALIILAYVTAFLLRFDFELPAERLKQFAVTLPFLLPIRLAAFWQFGIFRLAWRHIGLRDLFGLQAAVTLSSLLFVFALFFAELLDGMPRSVLIMDAVLSIFFCGGVMFATRYMREV